MKGVEARVDEVNRAKRTNEAEQVLVELVAATAYLQFPMTSRRQINAFEKAKDYLHKRKIDWGRLNITRNNNIYRHATRRDMKIHWGD